MKQLADYVKLGWSVEVTVTPNGSGINYSAWAYGHPDEKVLALAGEGDSMNAMLRDLQECEEELYPHLANDDNNSVSTRTKMIPTVFRMSSKPKGTGTNG